MATIANPPVIATAAAAWRDAFAAYREMPRVFWASTAALVVSFSFIVIGLHLARIAYSPFLSALTTQALYPLATAPLAIAVHRFVLLGQRTPAYDIALSDRRFRKFVLFALAFTFTLGLPRLFFGLVGFEILLVYLLVWVVAVSLFILFPAIAVGSPEACWRNAVLNSKGHGWRIFFTMICTTVPVLVAANVLLKTPAGHGKLLEFIQIFLAVVLMTFMVAAFAAAAARLYDGYAANLGRPPGLSLRPL